MLTLLLFPSSGSPADRLIARFEGSPTDAIHAAVLSGDVYYEAVSPLTRMMPAERLPANVRHVPLLLTDQQETAMVAYLRARVGTQHYSDQAIFADAIGLTTGRWLPVGHTNADCSGLIAEGLVAVGALSTLPRDPGTVSPDDLARWAAAGMPHDMGALLVGTPVAAPVSVR
jgi:hypothetical protein